MKMTKTRGFKDKKKFNIIIFPNEEDDCIDVGNIMIEVMEGGGVFWYAHQQAHCSAHKSWQSYINAAIHMFFKKETLAASCAIGNEKKKLEWGWPSAIKCCYHPVPYW
ncbi:uncharacterized protein LOC141886962 [Acropora palmata]|uniref:uncharacterized protein LOC141886962 n=1 Tax=Acropora palmata TaxID=6131 RepID=UPI003DA011B3